MVSRGLMIEECPSKGMKGMDGDSDVEVPCPEDSEEHEAA
eukprot:CAMPEP_0170467024 /NCGR_PEP_ID=MMETSP0123-20130129/10759_1 /TAXON_ID=182087 /ORGANISM="Favella ehrenbergii, Strain Fehren 1" /LENGTH=39 /DNA_ID= /DNA_START= /DNA_END= /DNA_ORIENTATION=